ncbi:putative hydrolase protein [Xylaria arbuscula]|nr:putative hydrolase protein [Xylaria arbuscula]
MDTTKTTWRPSRYAPFKAALLLLDDDKADVKLIQDPKRREELLNSTKRLLTAAQDHNIAIVHCLLDTASDPPTTSEQAEKWWSILESVRTANRFTISEYHEFAIKTRDTSDGSRESTYRLNPGYLREFVLLLHEKLHVTHVIMSGIKTSGTVLGTAIRATNLNFADAIVTDACWDLGLPAHRVLFDTELPVSAWESTVDEAVAYMKE